ncbi:MAG: hypothetical protein Q9181_004711 [Wetmoreana brouardii]
MHKLNGGLARSCRLLSDASPKTLCVHAYGHGCKTFATSIRRNDNGSSRPPKVTWYQQPFPGARNKQLIDPDEGDADTSEILQGLRERIAQLEHELEGDRGEDSRGQNSLIEPLLKQLSEEDRQKVRRALQRVELTDAERAEVEAESKALTKKALGGLADGHAAEILRQIELDDYDMILKLAPEQRAHLRRFNTCLKAAAGNNLDSKARKDLWVSYERCKRLIPSFKSHVPDKCWKILWKNQHATPPEGRDRTSHLKILAQDMAQSGRELIEEQRAILIDDLIDEGRLDDAREEWERQQHLGEKNAAKSHGPQGVRLFVSRGDLERAQEIADTIYKAVDPYTARCLIPVIEGWAKRGTDDSIRKAWALYLDLRTKLGSVIEIKDFDRVAMCFIHAGRTDVALAVFKDMMLSGRDSRHDSNQLYKTSLTLLGNLHSKSASPSEITAVSLSALSTLPRAFENKFFYGSWIKKLIGLGEIDAAVSVVELMYERGITPDAKHVNGIIGAWFRGGRSTHRDKAEQIAWAMIQRRLDLVRERRGEKPTGPSGGEPRLQLRIPRHIRRIVPSATIETFSLLLLYYGRRIRSDAVHELKDSLSLAGIPPNSYFMNHMLYAELRRGQPQQAWQVYQNLRNTVKPDLETFACLWDCEKAHLGKLSFHTEDELPGPRKIFYDLMDWYRGLSKHNRTTAQGEFSEEVYNQIVRCMCLAKDLEGTLVALYGLKESFGSLPNGETLRMIPMQVARIGLSELQMTGTRRRPRISELVGSKAMVSKVSRILDVVVEQRIEALNQKGIKLEECSTQRQNEEQVHFLADFLRVMLQRRYANDERAVNEAIMDAAAEMGVKEISLQDPLHSD